jgi:hypothetical protein
MREIYAIFSYIGWAWAAVVLVALLLLCKLKPRREDTETRSDP